MVLIPAIDIMEGKCVRLTKGDFNTKEVYYENPVDVAKMWEELGAKRIHVVDLDGAKQGHLVNGNVIEQITKNCKAEIEVGGGIRNRETIDYLFSVGVTYVILGSAAIYDKDLLLYSLYNYGERMIVGIDSKNGEVAVSGWLEKTKIKDIELAKKMKEIGVKTIIFTDISKDGTLNGPNFKALENILKTAVQVIASGGISSMEDLKKLKEMGAYGAIIGKALYIGKINFKSALEVI
ncbi:1-(5-phosphoribosyl)-5-((5-phosphoribosylamino)methylideneamino) imidazole-4-carboxamide isomerase [Thermoanaerobacter sp. YS13]|uniref:1-(5-phosphoribosyl)-5-[(5- phosphoribosylamino)methylideneamino]imidazole-4- carboxamide isomerase n=1 Tax=Thermoanaerobacter sp. YS13 TaxID=1511746 RepID=UPI00057508D1|nr:1-(5-phosphoribosyl)-5-[(5-phosphoribosylamino)methylideneamino]imidazole-4-carboxamide isomerase [Thermoanaerobacter sp. YS13]KHO63286.1 1-(5-phosphoribosyl)-5-((5-phosphoribosylamino)methylideneamino) imidazole-4-carboxamide isomerase [Thermoanaerobacter sp. YS13]